MTMSFGIDKVLALSASRSILATIDDKWEGASLAKRVTGVNEGEEGEWRIVEEPLRLQLFFCQLKDKAERFMATQARDVASEMLINLHSVMGVHDRVLSEEEFHQAKDMFVAKVYDYG